MLHNNFHPFFKNTLIDGWLETKRDITAFPMLNQEDTSFLLSISRTYAQAIAGSPVNMTFNSTTKSFELCYYPTPNDNTISSKTTIYANFKLQYPLGYIIHTTPNLQFVTSDPIVTVTSVSSSKEVVIGCVWISRNNQ